MKEAQVIRTPDQQDQIGRGHILLRHPRDLGLLGLVDRIDARDIENAQIQAQRIPSSLLEEHRW
ncbi:hypothetical protein D3C76_557440 [compost metagenome]